MGMKQRLDVVIKLIMTVLTVLGKFTMVSSKLVGRNVAIASVHIWRYRNKNYLVFYELCGVILISIGIAMIYLPAAFIAGGIAVLVLTQAEENNK